MYRSSGPLVFFFALLFVGCGGEDTSQPPSAIAERLAKAKAEAANQPPQQIGADKIGATPGSGSAADALAGESSDVKIASTDDQSGASLAAEKPPSLLQSLKPKVDAGIEATAAESVSANAATADPPAATADTLPAAGDTTSKSPLANVTPRSLPAEPIEQEPVAEKMADEKPTNSPTNRIAAANIEGETVTAGGKTEKQLDEQKKQDESVASAGMSLLDKLRGTSEPEPDKAAATPRASTRAAQVLTRTGRFAIAAETWLKLQNQLARRFFVAATADGAKIAASSGERSLGVLSTQVEVVGEERVFTRTANNVLAQTRTKKEVITQPVRNLPGILSAIELVDNGNVIAVGTYDGRVLARSCANVQDWDLYAQDLFAFLDERRPSARIAEGQIMALRAIDTDKMLIISNEPKCSVFKMSDVVIAPTPPLEMTEEQAIEPEAIVTTPEPLFDVAIPASTVINLKFSQSQELGAIITSDETVTVFDTATGEILDSVTAAQLDDTQPVSVIIEEDRKRLVIGLADGRIFRRAFADGAAVKGSDDKGNEVDYETVFAPDLGDNAGPITAMELKYDGRLLYMGRLDGTVTQFDLPRKQPVKSEKLHAAPIIEIRSTRAGAFTIADDRVAKLSDVVPGSTLTKNETFTLPRDTTLQQKVLIDDGKTTKKDKFTQARNFNRKVTAALDDSVTSVGIRPADPVLALYEHQLRVAAEPEKRVALREKIKKIRKPLDAAIPADEPPAVASNSAAPSKVAEILTQLDFHARPLRRAVMSISDDGTTLSVAQFYQQSMLSGAKPNQPVKVWDAITGTKLRTWRRSPGITNLDIRMDTGVILPTPMTAQLRMFDGRFMVDENAARYLTWQRRPADFGISVGLRGTPGVAHKMLQIIGANGDVLREGIEGFEAVVTAMAYSADGASLFVNLRERTKIRLLELESETLKIRSELMQEPVASPVNLKEVNLSKGVLGATHLLTSASGNLLVTYGQYDTGYQLRIWKKSKDKWPLDSVKVLKSDSPMLETVMTDTPMKFVEDGETQLAVTGPKGVGVINLREGSVESTLPLPNIEDRRPITALTPDGKHFLAGDREGRIWIWRLRSLDKKPNAFAAQAGPITGIAMSRNGQFLVTAGKENRLRVWDARYLNAATQKSARR